MKVLYNGEEIEFKTELEKGEVELDMYNPSDTDLDDTIDLKREIDKIIKEESNLVNTGEIKYE